MGSTIPAVVDDLLRRFGLALPGVQIVDGQPLPDTVEPDTVMVAFTGLPAEESISSTADRAQLAASPDRERYDVACVASSLRGEKEPQPRRVRVFEMLATLRGELQRDPTLGGLVLSARMAVLGFTQYQSEDGAVATVQFAVRIDAFAR